MATQDYDGPHASDPKPPVPHEPQKGILALIEKAGNKLPDPSILFLMGALLVMGISALVSWSGWEVQPKAPVLITDAATGQTSIELVDRGDPIRAFNLLSSDGIYWAIESMVKNFMNFPPLGIVLVGMLGIGIAERTGLIAVLLKMFMLVTPQKLLTPAVAFIGVMSSLASDAGYVVLPPLAAMLYISVGRSPLAGIATVFAGVSAGFSANLVITGLDPMLAAFSNDAAQTVDPDYEVAATANWAFMIVSTFMATLVAWFVTDRIVEPRFMSKPPEEGGPTPPSKEHLAAQHISPVEKKATIAAVIAGAAIMSVIVTAVVIPGAPLHGKTPVEKERLQKIYDDTLAKFDEPRIDTGAFVSSIETAFPDRDVLPARKPFVKAKDDILKEATLDPTPEAEAEAVEQRDALQARAFERWINAIVPLLFIGFIIPGIAYGVVIGHIKDSKDLAKLMIDSMAAMAPIIVLAFFAAQFIEYFKKSQLDTMLAMTGGEFLTTVQLHPMMLILLFIGITALFNLFVGSMSAKYALFAPIFIPMFMLVGISPELTQVAYRIGDSVTNIITPLNSYLIIILVVMQQYVKKAGMGTLISMMLPYSIALTIAWSVLLILWWTLGLPIGLPPSTGPMQYIPAN